MHEQALEHNLDLADYLAVIRRRLRLITLVSAAVFSIGLVVAFAWPPTYESSSTILIEEQEIPAELIMSTVTSYASQRIQIISQRVMTRANLMEIIERYDLYKSERKRNSIEEVLIDMRDDIKFNLVTADVLDPRTGRPTAATIAFNVGYKSEKPALAQKVASELTTLFLNENLRTRTEKATETYMFLTEEANRLKEEIAEHEQKLAEFKERNINTLPESRELNTEALARYESELANLDSNIQSISERKIYLEGQIPLLNPYVQGNELPGPEERLTLLQTEYIRLASRYSPDHPDVVAIKREIKALEIETGISSSSSELLARLDEMRGQLSQAEQQYTEEHPDVKRLRREIAALEEELKNPMPASTPPGSTSPDNPAFVNLQTQLAAAKSELASGRARRQVVLDKISEYEERLLQTPRVEQEFRILSRDLLNASARYQDILGKQMTAEVGKEMEAERKGEKFTLIDPAVLPEEPVSPNRPAIIFLAFILALGSGIGAAAIKETLDKSVRGVKGMMAMLQVAPLAVIPYYATAVERQRRSNRKILYLVLAVAGVIIVVALIHLLVTPLDVIWFKGWRKINNFMPE